MSLALDYVPMAGGLDEVSSLTDPRAGRLIASENFEILFGRTGYTTARGYERFDGRTMASTAVYHRVMLTAPVAFTPGASVTFTGGAAVVLRSSADELILWVSSGELAPGLVLTSGATTATILSTIQGSPYDTAWRSDRNLARAHMRGLIQAVPGSGPVRGVVIYKGDVYALRDAANGLTAALWRSSATGWVLVRAGLRAGGTLRARVDNFGGSTTGRAIFAVDGKNRYWRYDGTTFTFGPAVWGTEGSSTSSVAAGTGPKTFTIAEAGKTWAVGREVLIYSAADASVFMRGTVSAWAAPTLSVTVTQAAGGTAADWHVCAADGTDRPYTLAIHRNHLFLAYPGGQLQTSDVLNPLVFGSTSTLIGCGDDIRDLVVLRDEVMAIAQGNRIDLLYGTDKLTWDKRHHSSTIGSLAGSMLEAGGNAVFLSASGISTIQASQAFGNFEGATLSRAAHRTLQRLMGGFVGAMLHKSVAQYRIYGPDKQVLTMTASRDGGAFAPGAVDFMPLRYLHQPTCMAQQYTDQGELAYFGTADGYVMREASGTTYDGQPIVCWLRTSYWHHKAPHNRKRWLKLVADVVGIEVARLYARLDFDLGSDTAPAGAIHSSETAPAGGRFDQSSWNEFYWSSAEASQLEVYLEGVGSNASMSLWLDMEGEPVRIEGVTFTLSKLGAKR